MPFKSWAGEAFMTENELERIFRDSRINTVVEGRQRSDAELHLRIWRETASGKDAWGAAGGRLGDGPESVLEHGRGFKGMFQPNVAKAAMPLAKEIFLGWKPSPPTPPVVIHRCASMLPVSRS